MKNAYFEFQVKAAKSLALVTRSQTAGLAQIYCTGGVIHSIGDPQDIRFIEVGCLLSIVYLYAFHFFEFNGS
jgi:hypothetical protein